ncbi:LytR/AlgR family response regulator transcription factor [Pseudochryseolinea flava]|uniref:DNA-binding response regulator n=1 Tax=Pseudochryseolinea flava TaxID=2059302 RepID=A0A364Y594_9BACT|nr:response regulator transcription factor [Pseudochryseolinea flava]RAW02168.1 DNA-binding response regulator [Pseudochryseolinea flava]
MITKLRCVLLDDELPGLAYLKMLCEQIAEVEIVKAFNDPQKFMTGISSLDFDVCILDIEMPKMSGMQVAQLLKDKLIIFVTAHKQYAADAFDLDATDFVGKPVTKERLAVAIKKAYERKKIRSHERHIIQLNTDKGKALIDITNIAYITTSEVDSRDKVAVMIDQSSTVLKNISFEALHDQLPRSLFCRISKKQLIALKIVTSYTHAEISTNLTHGGVIVTLALSESYRQDFQHAAKGIS